MKLNKLLLVLPIALGIGVASTTSVANADTWHKGTPAAIRGRYRAYMAIDGKGGYSYYVIKKYNMHLYSHLVSTTTYTYLAEKDVNISYKQVGKNKYKVKFDMTKGQGHFAENNLTKTITKSGNSIKMGLAKYTKF